MRACLSRPNAVWLLAACFVAFSGS